MGKYNTYFTGGKKSCDKLKRVIIIYKPLMSLNQQEKTSSTVCQKDISSILCQQDISSTLCQQLAEIKPQCKYIIFNLMENHINIDPSLSNIID